MTDGQGNRPAPRELTIASELDIDADAAWELAQLTSTFRHVTRPLLTLPGDAPERLEPGVEMAGRLRLGGVVPLWRHRIRIESVDHGDRRIQTDERGGPWRVWRHTITVEELGPGRCRYRDHLVLDGGPLTAVHLPAVRALYAWRHRRWQTLA